MSAGATPPTPTQQGQTTTSTIFHFLFFSMIFDNFINWMAKSSIFMIFFENERKFSPTLIFIFSSNRCRIPLQRNRTRARRPGGGALWNGIMASELQICLSSSWFDVVVVSQQDSIIHSLVQTELCLDNTQLNNEMLYTCLFPYTKAEFIKLETW